VRAPDGSSSGWAGQPSPRIREINGAMLGEIAVGKCLQWRGQKKIEPGKFTVLLEPTAVSDLVRLMGQSFSARSAEEGRSFLSKKGGGTLVGEKMFPESVTLITDPFDRRNFGSPWSSGGMPTRRIAWIEKGVVRNLSYDRYWGSKAGKEPTPNPASLVLEGSEVSQQDLIASIQRGLLVTRFWYIRPVNPQTLQFTGLTRDGLFLIEDGKIAAPVMNLRFNESPVRMLQNVERFSKAIASQGGEGGGMVAPAIVARDFTFTSISDAV
jgi:predicted Zn-dependent protease